MFERWRKSQADHFAQAGPDMDPAAAGTAPSSQPNDFSSAVLPPSPSTQAPTDTTFGASFHLRRDGSEVRLPCQGTAAQTLRDMLSLCRGPLIFSCEHQTQDKVTEEMIGEALGGLSKNQVLIAYCADYRKSCRRADPVAIVIRGKGDLQLIEPLHVRIIGRADIRDVLPLLDSSDLSKELREAGEPAKVSNLRSRRSALFERSPRRP